MQNLTCLWRCSKNLWQYLLPFTHFLRGSPTTQRRKHLFSILPSLLRPTTTTIVEAITKPIVYSNFIWVVFSVQPSPSSEELNVIQATSNFWFEASWWRHIIWATTISSVPLLIPISSSSIFICILHSINHQIMELVIADINPNVHMWLQT